MRLLPGSAITPEPLASTPAGAVAAAVGPDSVDVGSRRLRLGPGYAATFA